MIKLSEHDAAQLVAILRKRESQQMARAIMADRKYKKGKEKRVSEIIKTRLLIQKLTP